MRLRFVVALVAGLAALTWTASVVVARTTRIWYERDLAARAQIAAYGTRLAIVEPWRAGQRDRIAHALGEMCRDERIMGATVCTRDGVTVASAGDQPSPLSCGEIAAARPDENGWHSIRAMRGGSVHVSAIPVVDPGETLGYLVVLQDIAFIERRDRWISQFLLIGFAVLSVAAAVVTLLAQRLSWRGWTAEMRRILSAGRRDRDEPAEFQPLLQDVRALIDRMSDEQADGQGGTWSAARLKHVLQRHLHGERVIILANREPYIHERAGDGVRVVHPASGLVTALEPVMRACSGTWVAHGGGSADRETADLRGRLRVPPGEESYVLRRVWLNQAEENGYYYGFSNEGLWPLCHMAYTRPVFRQQDWEQYRAVNRRFADAVCDEAETDDPIVLVQDYHYALAPRYIREQLPRATILTFWHIPWPNAEQFGVCPWRDELLDGLLGSSIMGFQTQRHCRNFIDGVDRYLEARIDREDTSVIQGSRTTLVRPYPISIEWPAHWLDSVPPVDECRASVRAELGLPPDALLGVGVDRLDYTKGIEERLLAVERLLERQPAYRGRFTFVQLAAPSRTVIERYRRLNDDVEQLARRINERFGSGDAYRPIVLRRAHHEPPAVFRHYRAADVCYVSSLDDGMNLVAKEFVAARDDERGVLVLSHFTGAARELTEALIVNPYDLEQASAALAAALEMPGAEQAERIRAMRSLVGEFNVYRWAGRMLVDAARVRGRERLYGRLVTKTGRRASEAAPRGPRFRARHAEPSLKGPA